MEIVGIFTKKASNKEWGTKQVIGRKESTLNCNYAVHLGSGHFRFICTLSLEKVGAGESKEDERVIYEQTGHQDGW